MKPLVFCLKCGECLGVERLYCTTEHERFNPTHDEYLVKYIKNPLAEEASFWFKYKIRFMPVVKFARRLLTERKTDDNYTEPDKRNCYLFDCFFQLLISVGAFYLTTFPCLCFVMNQTAKTIAPTITRIIMIMKTI